MTRKLLAIRLRSMLAAAATGKDKKGNVKSISKGKIVLFSFIYLLLAASLFAMAFSVASSIAGLMVSLGAEDIYYGIFSFLTFTFLFILSIFETKAELFDCKDNELLLSMPIAPKSIMISRISAILIYNYIIELVFMVPVVISALIFGGSVVFAIGAVLLILTIPLLATALSAGVGYLVHLASVRFAKFKNIAIIALSLSAMAIYFICYNAILNNFETILAELENNVGNAGGVFSILAFIGSVAEFAPIPLIVYLLSAILLTVIAGFVISKNYIKLMTVKYGAKKTEYKEKRLIQKSAFSAIVRKEFARFISSPTYMLNGGLGLILEIVLAVLIAVNAPMLFEIDPEILLEQGVSMEIVKSVLVPIIVSGLLFCEAMNMISASALSLEGKNLWIIKSIPVDARSVLLAKTIPNSVLNIGASVISGIIVAIGVNVSLVYYPICVLIPAAGGVLFSLMGIIINVLLPKFEFINEAQVVKQSIATFLSMLANIVFTVLIAAVAVLTVGLGVLGAYLTLLMILILCLIMYALVEGPISKKYLSL